MRYYLDTNIVVYSIFDKHKGDNLDKSTLSILEDYGNTFLISSIAVLETIHLFQIGKVKHPKFQKVKDVLNAMELINYVIDPANKYHLSAYCNLYLSDEHKDPFDHVIIAQSISDKIPIISSDRQFKFYEKQGLQLVFNKR